MAATKTSAEQKKAASSSTLPKLVVILVRGLPRIVKPIKDTLVMLKLRRKNHAVVLENTPAIRGMIKKVKDYVTWGEISEEVFQELIAKRGEEYQGRLTDSREIYSYPVLNFKGKKYKTYFRLNPPQKGFGGKGIKVAYAASGSLGYRGTAINDLILRML